MDPKNLVHTFPALLAAGLFLTAAESAAADVVVLSEVPALSVQEAVDLAGPQGMLIVDETRFLDDPLVLPQRFRLVGAGPQGQGALAFTFDSGSAITIAGAGDAWVTIENLDIEGLWAPDNGFSTSLRGIDVSGDHNVYLKGVTVRGFDVGVYGNVSFSLHAQDSNVSVNQTLNYHLANEAHSWRIVGGVSSQSGRAAILVEESNNVVIDSVRLESNQIGVYTTTESTHLLHNRFECSPAVPQFCSGTPVGVRIGAGAHGTTLVSNYYAGVEPVLDEAADGRTYRFDNGYTAAVRPVAGEEGLRIELPDPDGELVYDAAGRLRLGSEQGWNAWLTVNAPAGEEGLRVRTDGVTRLFVSTTGRVGVGTASPTERLHVNGNLRLDGDLVTTGEICIGSGC